MTPSPITVIEDTPLAEIADLMERKDIKRLPVVRGDDVVGIVTRANLLQAVASLARQIPDPTADDDHIRNRIIAAMEKNDWLSLSETQSCWQLISNRAMLLPYAGGL
jgi:predicted transcriptional regulator